MTEKRFFVPFGFGEYLFTMEYGVKRLSMVVVYSYHMCMRATVSLSALRQEPLHEGVSPRATVLVEGLTN